MAWAGPFADVQVASTASPTSIAFTGFGGTIPIGALLFVIACGNAATFQASSVADNSTQAGTANSYVERGFPNASALESEVYTTEVTRSILATDTITMTLSVTGTRVHGRAFYFTGMLTGGAAGNAHTTANGATVSPITCGATGALTDNGELGVMMSFWKGGAVLSGVSQSTSGYTLATPATGSGGTTSRVECNFSYSTTVPNTGTTAAHAFTSISSGCATLYAFRPAAAAAAAARPRQNVVTPMRRAGA